MKLLLYLLIYVINTILIIMIADGLVIGIALPAPLFKKKKYPEKYVAKSDNRLDFQKSTECSGFSAAHVLRSFGIEVDGNSMYEQMPGKLKNGAVLPKNLKKTLRQYGLTVRYRKGSPETLKAELSAGKRVIVFIKTRLDKRWLHYVSIVGYDEEHVFIAESLKNLANCEETYYNRKLTNQDFLRFWDTRAWYMPFYKNTYLVIEKENDSVSGVTQTHGNSVK